MERRKYDSEEQKNALVPDLRVYSRQAYLEKREAKKLDELEQALRDEETLFAVHAPLRVEDWAAGCLPMPAGDGVQLRDPRHSAAVLLTQAESKPGLSCCRPKRAIDRPFDFATMRFRTKSACVLAYAGLLIR